MHCQAFSTVTHEPRVGTTLHGQPWNVAVGTVEASARQSATGKLAMNCLRCSGVMGRNWLAGEQTIARKKQNFLDDLSNSGPAVRLHSEGRATARPEDQ
jgi:hypothetical protein